MVNAASSIVIIAVPVNILIENGIRLILLLQNLA